jgi:2-polyprenyl-3-methyl-5-hydroxy-6-metoxy-1,4-benzoquinol methylase
MRTLATTIRNKLDVVTVKRSIAANFLNLDVGREGELITSIKMNYLAHLGHGPDYVDSAVGRQDLLDHLYGRLLDDRRTVVPWLDSLRSLRGASILEIGCGAGASTIALAEQGALVTGVEIEANCLLVSADRCRLYGLHTPQFHVMNGAEIDRLELERFDFIIFSASLEHMTVKERLSAIRLAWPRLKAGCYLAVCETPNRLWWYDSHTSMLPFFNWLPDDLAVEYSTHSNRRLFSELYQHQPIDDSMRLKLSRWGRGASYHEFELSIPELHKANISCMNIWLRKRNPLRWAKYIASGDQRFARTLARSSGKNIHPAFCQDNLNLAIQKPA